VFTLPDASDIIAAALAEDLGVPAEQFSATAAHSTSLLARDVTSAAVVGLDASFAGRIVARQDAVVAGLPVIAAVYETLQIAADLFDAVEVFPLVAEGAHVTAGTAVAEVEGLAAAVYAGERTALDFLEVLSGIATETSRWVSAAGPALAVCDTRKTVPGIRSLSKYAVRVGGGTNHRAGLWDMVLVKDNHLARSASIAAAVAAARAKSPGLLVQIEADTLAQALEAVSAGADMILLDNFTDAELASAVPALRSAAAEQNRAVVLEASGGITIDRLPAIAASGVDRVSTSAITLGARPVDFALDEA
jgi:nicotinate-nucleotide pyrophosphorylase (carboxylating)